MPGSFIMQKNVYRQLPLFRFLERKAARDFQRKDPDTYAKIVENHTEYLGAMVEKENEEVRKEQEKVVGQAQKEAADKQKKDSEKETEKSQRNKSVTATPEVTPVSYTHLDVYKRQSHSTADCRKPAGS